MSDRPIIAATKPIEHRPGSFAEFWRVALPLILSSGSLSLMLFIDRMFLTWSDPSGAALAAATPAGLLHWTVISVFIGTALYVNTFVAQYEGAKRKDRAAAAVWQGIYLSFTAGAGFVFVLPFAETLFGWIGHEQRVQQLEVSYFSILCLGAIPITLTAVLSSFYSGRGKTVTVMCVNMSVVVINGILDYCLIFGTGPFPAMGIRGAAVATVIANILSTVIFFALMTRRCERVEYLFWKRWRFDRELFGRLLRYGLPTGFQFFIDISAFASFIFLVGRQGMHQLAATNLAFNVNTLAFIPMAGCGTAVMTLVAKRIGEGRPEIAVRTTWLAAGVAGAYMSFFALIYLFLPNVILYPFTWKLPPEEFAAVHSQAVVLLRFLAAFSVLDGMAIVFGMAVRGAGDTRFPLIFTLVTGWFLMVIPTWICWRWFDGSLIGSWTSCTVYICVLGIGMMLRFQSGRWKTMRVIEYSPDKIADDDIQPNIAFESNSSETALKPL
jgi:MATE family multidrug resistance protein